MMKQLTWLLQKGSWMKRSIIKVQHVQFICFKNVFAKHLTHHSKFNKLLDKEAGWTFPSQYTWATEAHYSHQLAQSHDRGSTLTNKQKAV